MKQSKVATPVLLFLMIVLLLIAIYYNFVFQPLESKIDALSMENELVKNQRMEIELAMVSEQIIKKDIEETKAILEEDDDYVLIDGGDLADDINANAKKAGVSLQDIIIDEPELAADPNNSTKALLALPADISFVTTYDKAVQFIRSFEESETGAYRVNLLDVTENEDGRFLWQVSLSLYFYGDPGIVPVIVEGAEPPDTGEKMWTQ